MKWLYLSDPPGESGWQKDFIIHTHIHNPCLNKFTEKSCTNLSCYHQHWKCYSSFHSLQYTASNSELFLLTSLFSTYQHLFHIVGAIFQTIVGGEGKSQSNNGLRVTIETAPYNKQTWNSKLRKRERRRSREKKMLTGSGVSSLISLSAPLPFALWNLSFITLSAAPVNVPWKGSSIGNCEVLVEVTGGTTLWSWDVTHHTFLGFWLGADLSLAPLNQALAAPLQDNTGRGIPAAEGNTWL